MYESLIERAKKKGHVIIVVADGAYRGVIDEDKEKLHQRNPKAPRNIGEDDIVDLALFMKGDLGKYAESEHKIKLTIKYLDPRQVVRARPANSVDTDLCHNIAYCTAHSAMNGYTDFATCKIRE